MTCRTGVSFWSGLAQRVCTMFNNAGYKLELLEKGDKCEAKPAARAFLVSHFAQDRARPFSQSGPSPVAALATLEEYFQQEMAVGNELAIETDANSHEFTVFHYDRSHDALIAARTMRVGKDFRLEG